MSTLGAKISTLVAVSLIFCCASVCRAGAVKGPDQVCDVTADAALTVQDYPTAIYLHRKLLRSEGNNALAHYHLGFAYGMVGRTSEEIGEYREAIRLGLNTWDLFMNLGLAYYDRHEVANAMAALETAVSLGPGHAETHFNLAVVYERENRLNEALQEIIAALLLAPRDLDAANTDAIICARMGDVVCARNIWTQLIRSAPDYAPARANLTILNGSCGGACDPDSSPQTALWSQFGSEE
ncbi:MAG TPA: tetratricopeptide repeat protein [Candidatus Binataceae bacterium]|nr:tetratricopeptide repeat protein [Candidatus Binataceae bacterium]